MEVKETLEMYRNKECPKQEDAYCGDFGSELLFKARTMSLTLNARTHRWNKSRLKECGKYSLEVDETVRHFLMECEFYREEREAFLTYTRGEVGEARWAELVGEGQEVCEILGLGRDRPELLEKTKEYLMKIWKMRGDGGR